MNLSVFCIRRPVFTTLLMISIVVAGVVGYRTLSVSALPRVDFPTISVSASLPGASPEVMAASVATPLERQFATIPGVSSITSSSFLGNTQISLQFDLDRDIDGAALDVQTAISTAQRRLPPEMRTPPSFQKVNPADQPIFFLVVSSESLPLAKVNEYADTMMSQRIATLPGVAQVSIYGQQKYAVRVQADPSKLAAQDLGFIDLRNAIASAASTTPVGVISGKQQLYNLTVEGQPESAEGFRQVVVAWRNGAPVHLQDVAVVSDAVSDLRTASNIDGKNAVVLAVQRQPDANTIEVVERIRKLLPTFRAQLPASVEVTPMFDRSVSIRHSVEDVQFTLQLTIGLVVLVIFLFLRHMSATIIAALAVPLSIVATYGAMALLGFSINNVSLLALTLCVGFVVDDAIVMLENIMRYVEKGMSPMEASLKGSKEIGFTILSMTFSLVAVFIPVLFMGGIVGRLFSEFAITISVAILISGFVSLTLTPMLCSRWLKPHSHKEEKPWAKRLEAGFDKLLRAYDRSLQVVLRHQRITLFLTLASLVATVMAFNAVPKSFFPQEDTGFIFGSTESTQDISFEAMVTKQKLASEIVRADSAVEHVFYAVGGSRGAYNTGRLFFSLKPIGERPPAKVVIARLKEKLKEVQGFNVFMNPVQNIQIGGRQSKSLYQYTLQGTDLRELYQWAEVLEKEMTKLPFLTDVTSDLQLRSLELRVKVDQEKAASHGVTYDDVRNVLYAAYGTQQVATLYTQSDDFQVILEASPALQKGPDDIKALYVRSSEGKLVPLDTFVTITQGLGSLTVNHQSQLAAVTLSFNIAPGASLSTAVDAIKEVEKRIGLPGSVIPSFQGSAQAFQDSASGQAFLLLIAITVIYLILGMLYESFIHPITILSGLPSAGLGALATLLLFKLDLSVIAMIGIILLIGIVKKNAIMMIDFAIEARQGGAQAQDAIYQACLLRFRPIMMTTMAAILGTLPIAVGYGAGSEFRQPLGIAVVGGLLTSQLLTLYITPVVYLYLERLSTRFKAR